MDPLSWNELLGGVRAYGRRPAILVFAVTVLSLIVAFILPKWYRATTTLLPPEQTSQSIGLLSNLIESSALGKVGLVTASSPSDLYAEMLRSRRVREEIVERFDLQDRYHVDNLDKCLGALDDHLSVDVLPSRMIVVQFEDKDPEFAAQVANGLVETLHRVDMEIHSERAARTRAYLEKQLLESESRLRDAENLLTGYEQEHGVITGMDEAAIQGAAELIARKLALQVRRSWMQSYVGRQSPALQAIDSELAALDREISLLPTVKQEAARLALDVEIQRRVYTLVVAQYEEARIKENSTITTISVLDPARAPTIHARPRKSLVVGGTFAAALLLAAGFVLYRIRRDLFRQGRLQ